MCRDAIERFVSAEYGNRKYWVKMRFETRWVLLSVLMLLIIGIQAQTLASSGREYKIKAAFLLNFLKFIEFPAEAFSSSDAAFVLGILGTDPFGDAIEPLAGKRVKGRTIRIDRFKDLGQVTACHILYISDSEKDKLVDILQEAKGRAVLTVGDADQFARKGGIIGFVTFQNKIRFEINMTAADQANLKISSKLLKLAKIIK